MSKILVVDDEQSICWALAKLCRSMGHEVETAASAEQGLALAAERSFDLLLLDVRLPGMDGLSAIAEFRPLVDEAPVIVMTAFGDLQTAVQAVQSGAVEYLLKPFDLAEVRAVIHRSLNVGPVATAPKPKLTDGEMIGNTPAMQNVFKRIALAAASNANVLLQGESGVGKDLAARAIHQHSPRSEAPFVAVNVAALSPSLAESELFGHVDGAFTGAKNARGGLLAQADGGTLFLDEIADIPLPLQVKLLRAIEQAEVLPVGADKPVSAKFRVVSATHQDLRQLARAGKFRHDLYYRISAFEIEIPPLRDRREDIPLLAAHFASQLGNGELLLAAETLEELQQRPWYGNVRELRNAIEHAQVVARSGVVLPEHLPDVQASWESLQEDANSPVLYEASSRRAAELLDDPEAAGSIYSRFLQEVEAPLLQGAMERFDNECAPAARALGLHRTTLKKKLDEHHFGEKQ